LDLGRTGVKIGPAWLSPSTLENTSIVNWAHRRARTNVIPDLLQKEWGIRTDRWAKAVKDVSRQKKRQQRW
jgi:hypothetical protein